MGIFLGVCWRLVATIFVALTAVVWFDLGVKLFDSGHEVRAWLTVTGTSLYVFYVYWCLWAKWFYDFISHE